MSCGIGHRHSLNPVLLWLWCRPAAPIRALVWELSYAAHAALKRRKKKGGREDAGGGGGGKKKKKGREKEKKERKREGKYQGQDSNTSSLILESSCCSPVSFSLSIQNGELVPDF